MVLLFLWRFGHFAGFPSIKGESFRSCYMLRISVGNHLSALLSENSSGLLKETVDLVFGSGEDQLRDIKHEDRARVIQSFLVRAS